MQGHVDMQIHWINGEMKEVEVLKDLHKPIHYLTMCNSQGNAITHEFATKHSVKMMYTESIFIESNLQISLSDLCQEGQDVFDVNLVAGHADGQDQEASVDGHSSAHQGRKVEHAP
jgi:hypothetical protein